MALKIYWTDFSKSKLRGIFDYYKEKASLRIARKLVNGITQEVIKLQNQPNIGSREELLTEREQDFRYLVHKNYKIIYWINQNQNRVEISDVFDTRQNPYKVKNIK
jgi:plasmid stabilization system protein ParE